uniref:Prefoldin subunit 2 n=1 Tax=Clastoptera arizonana TaxID=38151 RepID=A0A1B6DU85_9HEMI
MASSSTSKGVKSSKEGDLNEAEIYAKFNSLRLEQRRIAENLSSLENQQSEHKIVLNVLKDLDGDRKCFRMVGEILVERTVKEVYPILTATLTQLGTVVERVNEQLLKKRS